MITEQRFIDVEAPTVGEAVEKAKNEIELSERPFRYVIIDKGERGRRPCRIRIFLNIEEVELIESVIKEFFGFLGVQPELRIVPKQKRYYVNITTRKYDAAFIGKNGENLRHLNYILGLIIRRKNPDLHLSIDISGYLERKRKLLINKIIATAKRVKETGKEMSLDYLSEMDIRIVKDALKKEKGVVLRTVGKEPHTIFVIAPKEF